LVNAKNSEVEMKKATCQTSGFSHIFSGTQLFDGKNIE